MFRTDSVGLEAMISYYLRKYYEGLPADEHTKMQLQTTTNACLSAAKHMVEHEFQIFRDLVLHSRDSQWPTMVRWASKDYEFQFPKKL